MFKSLMVIVSSLVCMVGVIFLYIDTIYEFFYGFSFFCLVGCFSIVWTPTVLSVLYACVLYFLYLHLFCAIEHVSHGKAL